MIIIKNNKEIDLVRLTGRIVAEMLLLAGEKVRSGTTVAKIDGITEEFVIKHGTESSFKGLYGSPTSLCISVSGQVVYGISGGYVLKDGDIANVDCGAYLNGFYGDTAKTLAVGNANEETSRLIRVTEQSFFEGIEYVKVSNRLAGISHGIQNYIEASGFAVVRDFVGHGIGRVIHEGPDVPDFGRPDRGPKLAQGTVLIVEPMVNLGSYKVKILNGDWAIVTSDGSLSAHYENTIVILPDRPEILALIK